ncbi:unnamed protein product [Urochloa decumbens]|uniref:Acid phosphatase 1 n=1 Tax=Urochloa decumbens TaxID=240449 RepID=A0ABC9GMM9_9POAL
MHAYPSSSRDCPLQPASPEIAMAMATAKLALLVVLLAATSYGALSSPELRGLWTRAERAVEAAAELFVEEDLGAPVIHALRPLVGSADPDPLPLGVPWDSWRLAVETGNIIDWKTVPAHCEQAIVKYLLGDQYGQDSKVVIDEAVLYSSSFKLRGNDADKEKLVWLFDIDETVLSSLPYYAKHGFGTKPLNFTSLKEYVLQGISPALPETLRLYSALRSSGIKIVFLSSRKEQLRNITEANLRLRGFSDWFKLLLKPDDCEGTAIVYKSGERKKLQDAGYVIVGSIGDQWSDLIGQAEGKRVFKLPNPMYYTP